MVDRIRRGFPIKLPPYRYDGSDKPWIGLQPESGDADLPIAYLRAHLLAHGWTIKFLSTMFSSAGNPMAVPCIYLIYGATINLDLMTEEQIDRANLLPLIIAEANTVPQNNDGEDYTDDLLAGMPMQVSEPRTVLDTEKFLGGRVYVVYFGFSPSSYHEFEAVDEDPYIAQPGGADL